MKKLIALVFFLSLLGCKKEEIKPSEEPIKPPDTIDSCKTGYHFFDGVWIHKHSLGQDTLIIDLASNNCPVENSNNYVVHGSKKAFHKYAVDSTRDWFFYKDFDITTSSEEPFITVKAKHSTAISINVDGTELSIKYPNILNADIKFKKQ